MTKKHFWTIENKILIPFVTITIGTIMTLTSILYYNGYHLKLDRERVRANSMMANIEVDLASLYGILPQSAVLQKYRTLGFPKITILDHNGVILIEGKESKESSHAKTLASSRSNQFGWTIQYTVDMNHFQSELIEEQKYMILATIALLTIIIQSSIFIAHNISEPIRQLSRTCREISEAPHASQGIALKYQQRHDEIGQLSTAFQTMIDGIHLHTDALNEIRLLNESIIDNLPSGIIAFDENQTVICINPKAQLLLTNDSFLCDGKTLFDILNHIVNNNSIIHDPFHFENQEGKVRELEIGVWRLERPNAAQNGLICTLDDVTYKKLMEEKINENEKLAYTGTVAASLAHEIRNPLAGIRTSIQVIAKRLDSPSDKNLCQSIVGEVDRVNILIEDLLNVSRKRESQKQVLSLEKLFNELALLYSKVFENSHIDIQIECENGMTLYADEGELKQVLINLINNSIRAMPNGGSLHLSATTENGTPVIRVVDNGHGLSPEMVDAINENRLRSGLGLSIVAKLLKQNFGEFYITDTSTAGTCITITFKRQD